MWWLKLVCRSEIFWTALIISTKALLLLSPVSWTVWSAVCHSGLRFVAHLQLYQPYFLTLWPCRISSQATGAHQRLWEAYPFALTLHVAFWCLLTSMYKVCVSERHGDYARTFRAPCSIPSARVEKAIIDFFSMPGLPWYYIGNSARLLLARDGSSMDVSLFTSLQHRCLGCSPGISDWYSSSTMEWRAYSAFR
jgi:hypothetical protein